MVYDNFQRLLSQTHQKDSTTLGSSAVTYDSNRRIDSLTTPDGVGDFTYDGSGQLLDADYDFQADEAFTYDLTGNRTLTGYMTGPNNQLLSDGTHNYEYDNEGNRTRKTTINNGDCVTYAWDPRNRLMAVTFRDSSNIRTKEILYTYDVWNRRLRRQLDSNGDGTIDEAANLAYDAGAKNGLEDLLFVFDGSNQLEHRFLQGPEVDQPLPDEQSFRIVWLLAGHLGTITDVAEYDSGTDTTTVVNHLTYNSYGKLARQTNSAKEPHHTYTARTWDGNADLYYYRARWYDATVGRFVNEDPIGFESSSTNLYQYALNIPVIFTDPSGAESWIPFPTHGGTTYNPTTGRRVGSPPPYPSEELSCIDIATLILSGQSAVFMAEANRRQNTGELEHSGSHCWAACKLANCWYWNPFWGQVVAINLGLFELGGVSDDWAFDIYANHLGALCGNAVGFGYYNGSCDECCGTYRKK